MYLKNVDLTKHFSWTTTCFLSLQIFPKGLYHFFPVTDKYILILLQKYVMFWVLFYLYISVTDENSSNY